MMGPEYPPPRSPSIAPRHPEPLVSEQKSAARAAVGIKGGGKCGEKLAQSKGGRSELIYVPANHDHLLRPCSRALEAQRLGEIGLDDIFVALNVHAAVSLGNDIFSQWV